MMKKVVFFLFFAVLFTACHNHKCTCTGYTIDNNPCECLYFQAKIGINYDSALDSLKRLNELKLNKLSADFYSGSYFINKEKIDVDFKDDDREFFHIMFMDSIVTYRILLGIHDVLDDKGNHYIYDFTYER